MDEADENNQFSVSSGNFFFSSYILLLHHHLTSLRKCFNISFQAMKIVLLRYFWPHPNTLPGFFLGIFFPSVCCSGHQQRGAKGSIPVISTCPTLCKPKLSARPPRRRRLHLNRVSVKLKGWANNWEILIETLGYIP